MISLIIPCSGGSAPCSDEEISLFGIVWEFARKVLDWLRDLSTGTAKMAESSANSLIFSLFSGKSVSHREGALRRDALCGPGFRGAQSRLQI